MVTAGYFGNIESILVKRIGLEEIIVCVFAEGTSEGDSFNFTHVAVI